MSFDGNRNAPIDEGNVWHPQAESPCTSTASSVCYVGMLSEHMEAEEDDEEYIPPGS